MPAPSRRVTFAPDEPGEAGPGGIEVAGGDGPQHGMGFVGEHPPADGDGRGDERGGAPPEHVPQRCASGDANADTDGELDDAGDAGV